MKSFQAVDRIVFVRSRQQMLVAAFLPKNYFLTTFLLNQAHGDAVMPWCSAVCVFQQSTRTFVSSFHRRRVPLFLLNSKISKISVWLKKKNTKIFTTQQATSSSLHISFRWTDRIKQIRKGTDYRWAIF